MSSGPAAWGVVWLMAVLAPACLGSGAHAQSEPTARPPRVLVLKGSKQGTGLGLASVYGIARQHGGTVYASAREPRGTCMRVCLPQTERPEDRPSRSTSHAESNTRPSRGSRVLVVEDDDAVRALVIAALEGADFQVLAAASPEEALEQLDASEPLHLLLTDVAMPGMNGPQLAAEVARRAPTTRTLYMSGHDAEAVHGVRDSQLLRKPFSASTLVHRVEQRLSSRAP